MQDQRRHEDAPADEHDVAGIVLDLVLARHPSVIAIEDLFRELCHPALLRAVDEPLVHDALVDLVVSGLIHRSDQFVIPSRAAVRSRELVV